MAKIRITKHQQKTLALIAAGGEMSTDYDQHRKTVILLDGKETPVPPQTIDAMIDRGLIEKRVDKLPIRYWKLTARGRQCVPKTE